MCEATLRCGIPLFRSHGVPAIKDYERCKTRSQGLDDNDDNLAKCALDAGRRSKYWAIGTNCFGSTRLVGSGSPLTELENEPGTDKEVRKQ